MCSSGSCSVNTPYLSSLAAFLWLAFIRKVASLQFYRCNFAATNSLCSACCPIAAKGADVRKPCALDQAVQGVPPLTKGINPATWMLEVSTLAKEAQLRVNFADIYRNSSLYRWAPAPTKISKHFFIVFLWSPSCNAGHGGRGPTAHCFSVVRFSVAQYWNAALLYTLSWRLQSLSAASFENDTHRCMCIPNVMVDTMCILSSFISSSHLSSMSHHPKSGHCWMELLPSWNSMLQPGVI